jgi:hypothetical protein
MSEKRSRLLTTTAIFLAILVAVAAYRLAHDQQDFSPLDSVRIAVGVAAARAARPRRSTSRRRRVPSSTGGRRGASTPGPTRTA